MVPPKRHAPGLCGDGEAIAMRSCLTQWDCRVLMSLPDNRLSSHAEPPSPLVGTKVSVCSPTCCDVAKAGPHERGRHTTRTITETLRDASRTYDSSAITGAARSCRRQQPRAHQPAAGGLRKKPAARVAFHPAYLGSVPKLSHALCTPYLFWKDVSEHGSLNTNDHE